MCVCSHGGRMLQYTGVQLGGQSSLRPKRTATGAEYGLASMVHRNMWTFEANPKNNQESAFQASIASRCVRLSETIAGRYSEHSADGLGCMWCNVAHPARAGGVYALPTPPHSTHLVPTASDSGGNSSTCGVLTIDSRLELWAI